MNVPQGEMKQMPIVWARLVKGGETCTRCENTGHELESAVTRLAATLRPLGIEPVLETRMIDEAAFKADPSESNRVWIAGKPVEEYLGADVGMSRCCSVCGDLDCRTLEVDGRSYETISEELFITARLMAASRMIARTAASGEAAKMCCGGTASETAPCTPTGEQTDCGCRDGSDLRPI